MIVKNPCVLKGAGVERSAERPTATPALVWALADAIDARFSAMVLTAAFLGLRYGELAGLARRHINLLHRSVTLERALVEIDGRRTFGPPKTDAGTRAVAIPDDLVPILETHLDRYAGTDPDSLVFCGAKSAPLSRGHWSAKWRAARGAVDLPDGLRFHDLRHTANTRSAATGASTRELVRRMGHASPAAALRYQHATDERDAEIADALGALLGSARRPLSIDETQSQSGEGDPRRIVV